MFFPQIFRVAQQFDGPREDHIAEAVDRELSRLKLAGKVRPGQTVAVTAGSRGIANIALVIRSIVRHLEGLGLRPFVVPAMGSHGGGTVAGQLGILRGYGITEEYLGCPIRATMETVVVCHTPEGVPVHFDRFAREADHVLVCGRIKPHTAFVGEIESGLMKMMLIGLGKHAGATIYHRAIQDYSFGRIINAVAGQVLAECRILAGVGIVENAYDQTALIAAVAPEEFESREKELLVLAKRWMPKLPFGEVDVLIVDQIGKDISGAGMDCNVVGRKLPEHAGTRESPRVRRIIVRELTAATHGNATGIGLADFCTSRVVEQTDLNITYINSLTGGHPEAARLPIHFPTDRQLLEAALGQIGLKEPADARLLWIRHTLDLAEVECSTAYLAEARQRPDLDVIAEPRDMPLDAQGNLPSVARLSGRPLAAPAHS
ncbi:MAG TPA: lactate racemase domain-containing protein [Pirellulales bacterium]|jgi:hypothetical protein|nr:lactate racemase domain-containing protein [Pirellulales bacterium]